MHQSPHDRRGRASTHLAHDRHDTLQACLRYGRHTPYDTRNPGNKHTSTHATITIVESGHAGSNGRVEHPAELGAVVTNEPSVVGDQT